MRSRSIWITPPAVRMLACVVLCLVLPASAGEAAPMRVRSLGVRSHMHLQRAYHLAVVEVPDPPVPQARAGRPSSDHRCPVEVRAIVQGETRDTTFTVIAWGEHSTLLSAGEGVKTSGGWLAVSRIAADHVVVRRGDVATRCELNSAAAPSRRHPAR